jgi:pteridine reductase
LIGSHGSPFFEKISVRRKYITAKHERQVTGCYQSGLQSSEMLEQSLKDKTILITGAARRLGRMFARTCARAGADVVIHHAHSEADAESLRAEIVALGQRAWVVQADLSDSSQTGKLIPLINRSTPLHILINSAAIFESLTFDSTTVDDWNKHLALNLTAPFLLSQAFARQADEEARIVNILDWRALRPTADHFPYTVSKSALAALTKSLAVALAPKIIVNGLALGAILPPADGNVSPDITKNIPMKRWANENEVEQALLFLLTSPAYITGEIIHVDGGRHLV